MDTILNKLFDAADNHGEDTGEPDHTVGDLQDLLRKAVALMTPSQQLELLQSVEVDNMVETGAREEFDVEDLVAHFEAGHKAINERLAQAAYSFDQGEFGHYWVNEQEQRGPEFKHQIDAAADAYAHLMANTEA